MHKKVLACTMYFLLYYVVNLCDVIVVRGNNIHIGKVYVICNRNIHLIRNV